MFGVGVMCVMEDWVGGEQGLLYGSAGLRSMGYAAYKTEMVVN